MREREEETEREREEETETERQRDRETERQRDRETERQRDRETERQRDRETEIQRERDTARQRDREAERQKKRERECVWVVLHGVCDGRLPGPREKKWNDDNTDDKTLLIEDNLSMSDLGRPAPVTQLHDNVVGDDDGGWGGHRKRKLWHTFTDTVRNAYAIV